MAFLSWPVQNKSEALFKKLIKNSVNFLYNIPLYMILPINSENSPSFIFPALFSIHPVCIRISCFLPNTLILVLFVLAQHTMHTMHTVVHSVALISFVFAIKNSFSFSHDTFLFLTIIALLTVIDVIYWLIYD